MKNLFSGLIASSVLALTACNGNAEKKSESTTHGDHSTETAPAANDATSNEQSNFSELYAHYQHLTFALSSDNDKEAANAAKGMLEALPKIKSDGYSSEDKTSYEDIAADLKEPAEYTAYNVGHIHHKDRTSAG